MQKRGRGGSERDPNRPALAKIRGYMIRQARNRLRNQDGSRMRQADFGALMGVGVAAVYQWECGRRLPTRTTWRLFEMICRERGIKFDSHGKIVSSDSPTLRHSPAPK